MKGNLMKYSHAAACLIDRDKGLGGRVRRGVVEKGWNGFYFIGWLQHRLLINFALKPNTPIGGMQYCVKIDMQNKLLSLQNALVWPSLRFH